jgi:C4-dicarboxylate transporter DctQ subunit
MWIAETVWFCAWLCYHEQATKEKGAGGVMTRISQYWESFEESVISLLLVATTLLVFFEVFMRFVLHTGFLWMEEMTLHLSAWMVLFGAAWGVKVGAHIGVDAFIRHFSDGARRLLGVLAVILSLIYCALIGYGAFVYLGKLKRIGIELEDLPIPKWEAHSILLIGMVLLALRLLELLVRIARGQTLGFESVDEARKALEEISRDGAEGGADISGVEIPDATVSQDATVSSNGAGEGK